MITDVLVAAAGVTPAVLVDADHRHRVEAGRVADERTASLGQHRVVRGVPRDRESFSDPGHRQVLAHDSLQRPPQRTA